MKKIVALSGVVCLFLSINGYANDFKTKTELSYLNSSGNSDVSSGAVLFDAEKKIDKHEIKGHYEWFYSEENSVENKNKMMGSVNYLYNFGKKFSFDYILQGEQDKFSGFDYKVFTGPGLKYKVFIDEKNPHQLSLGGNIVAEQDKPENLDAENYIAFLANEAYSWQISENLKLKQDFKYRVDVADTSIYNITANVGIENKLNKYFSLGANYKVDYTNTVLPTKERTDKIFTASLIINY